MLYMNDYNGLKKKKETYTNLNKMTSTHIEKAFINRMDYYKVLKNKLQVKTSKVGLISLRNIFVANQKLSNYQNEYDRIRGELSRNKLQGKTVERLNARKETLEKLGAQAFNSIKSK